MRPTRLRWTAALALITTTALLTGGAVSSPALADCPAPSYVGMWKSNDFGGLRHGPGHSLTTLAPGGEIFISAFDLATDFANIALGGDVEPGTNAVYQLTGTSSTSWTTKVARRNGVIHHDDEIRLFGTSVLAGGLNVGVTVDFTDECSDTRRTVFLGTLKVTDE
ncbi:hypothetical protein [Nonomuraea endophytica]|uniref:hypothetical protein n=1 Tax=Nonomuraea endophytica TaxID=714136 RepID=UPI0037C85019